MVSNNYNVEKNDGCEANVEVPCIKKNKKSENCHIMWKKREIFVTCIHVSCPLSYHIDLNIRHIQDIEHHL